MWLLLRGVALCEETIALKPDDLYQRTIAMEISLLLIGAMTIAAAEYGENLARIGKLIEPPGMLEPRSLEGRLGLAFGIGFLCLAPLGALPQAVANSKNPAHVPRVLFVLSK